MNLIGFENGFHPLDATGTEHFEIAVNSCRRAAWWTTLGPCPPLTVKLSGLMSGGGCTAMLKVCVARVYPVLYHCKIAGKTYYLRLANNSF